VLPSITYGRRERWARAAEQAIERAKFEHRIV
jgi:hypothetical protein